MTTLNANRWIQTTLSRVSDTNDESLPFPYDGALPAMVDAAGIPGRQPQIHGKGKGLTMTATHRLKHLICLVSLAFGSAAGLGLLAAGSATADPAQAAPSAQAGALVGYTTPGQQHVDYIGTNGEVYELFYNGSHWIATSLSAAAG